jgi:hypothetical protein
MATRQPTNILKMSDAFKRNPARLRERESEPQPTGAIGEAPKELTKREREIWCDLIAEAPPNVLTNADRFLLAVTAKLYLKVLKGKGSGFDQATLARNLGKLGLSPADRSKIKTPVASPKNTFSDLDE